MFTFGKEKNKVRTEEVDVSINECISLKNKITVLMQNSRTVSSEEVAKINIILEDCDILNEEILSYKGTPSIKIKKNHVASLYKMRDDLEAIKKMLEVY